LAGENIQHKRDTGILLKKGSAGDGIRIRRWSWRNTNP